MIHTTSHGTMRNQSAWLVFIFAIGLPAALRAAETAASITARDPELKVVVIDSAATESFLGIRIDATGRIFVGGRGGVFVMEPGASGGYASRQQLVVLPDNTWVHDIEIRGDDLYVLTISALYMIPNGRVQRDGLEIRRLVWGAPRGHTHQGFHGMTWGPEGDLYFGMGDPLWFYGDFDKRPDHLGHWTFLSRRPGDRSGLPAGEQWERTPYVGVGAVLRCRPDGSGLRIVAGGLRNNCGLAFDRHWNLFTNDNDHESRPADYVPGRLLHVTPHAWFGWPRGWTPDKTPDRLDLLSTLTPDLGRFVPVGQTYYDDMLLPARYRNALLVARWCTRQVGFYPLEHAGASFRCTEGELVAGSDVARPVNVTVGRGGRVFATVCHMQHNDESPIYKSDVVMVTTANDPDSLPFVAIDPVSCDTDRLFAELADRSWSRRKEAHAELLRRNTIAPATFLERWDHAAEGGPSREHLLWLMGMRADEDSARDRLIKASQDQDASIRLQAIRCLAERFTGSIVDLPRLLADADPQVRLASVAARFEDRDRTGDDTVADELMAGPAVADDTYLRQTATRLLALRCDAERLGTFVAAASPKVRLAAVLAAGFRLTLPQAVSQPAESLPLSPWNERACVLQYADETRDLRKMGRLGAFTVAEHWRSGNHTADQEKLFELLLGRLDDSDEAVRLQASHFLNLLDDKRSEAGIVALRKEIEAKKMQQVAHVAAATPKPGEFLPADRPAWDLAVFHGTDWEAEVRQGDAARGEKLFGHGGVGCVKCHAINDAKPVAGGPSLSSAGKRFTVAYLAESVLVPGKVVAPLFRATTVVTTDGRSVTGLVSGETAEAVELILPDATRVTVPVSDIEDRVVQSVSPMPEGLVRTREELRDLLAYMLVGETAVSPNSQ